jgi:hypothetical protein
VSEVLIAKGDKSFLAEQVNEKIYHPLQKCNPTILEF